MSLLSIENVTATLCIALGNVDWSRKRGCTGNDLMLIGQSMSSSFQDIECVIVVIPDDSVARNTSGSFQGGMCLQIELGENRADDGGVNNGSVRNIELVVFSV